MCVGCIPRSHYSKEIRTDIMSSPQQPPALVQQIQNLFENPSVAYTAVVSLRDQCIVFQQSAKDFFVSGRARTDGSTDAPSPPEPKEVDCWLAAASGAASPFAESHVVDSNDCDDGSMMEDGWSTATFSSRKWDVIVFRWYVPQDEAVEGTGGDHRLMMITFRCTAIPPV
jgi:hypothetical protein